MSSFNNEPYTRRLDGVIAAPDANASFLSCKMTHPRIKFEEQLMSCWNITGDIKSLCEAVCDSEHILTPDVIANVLIGLEELYNMKFDKLFLMFENGDSDRAGYNNCCGPTPNPIPDLGVSHGLGDALFKAGEYPHIDESEVMLHVDHAAGKKKAPPSSFGEPDGEEIETKSGSVLDMEEDTGLKMGAQDGPKEELANNLTAPESANLSNYE